MAYEHRDNIDRAKLIDGYIMFDNLENNIQMNDLKSIVTGMKIMKAMHIAWENIVLHTTTDYWSGTEIKHSFSLTTSHHIDDTQSRNYGKYYRIMDHIRSEL
eukprot:7944012-Heterocapsa_arctica.AAC.1